MTYSYSARDLLAEPHSYMYTPFEGTSLFDAYFLQRSQRMNEFAVRVGCEESDGLLTEMSQTFIGESLRKQFPETYRHWAQLLGPAWETTDRSKSQPLMPQAGPALDAFSLKGAVATSDLAIALINSMLIATEHEDSREWLDRLIQRFEVTKRLYDTYGPGFRKGSGDFESLRRYWLLALALCISLSRVESPRLLNTLLKVCDLLCSVDTERVRRELSNTDMRLVLATEGAMVRALMHQKGLLDAAG